MSTSALAPISLNQLQVLSNYVPSRTHDGVIYVVIPTKHSELNCLLKELNKPEPDICQKRFLWQHQMRSYITGG